MANLREIRRRIKSVKNTSQITKAMQMVASAKMRKAQDHAVHGRPYIAALANVLSHLREAVEENSSPLMRSNDSDRELVILVNTDRGLCGGLNANLLKYVREHIDEETDFITIGKKLNPTLSRLGYHIFATWTLHDPLAIYQLEPILNVIVEKFLAGEYHKVSIAYSGYVNVMVQRPQMRPILPIQSAELIAISEAGGEGDAVESGNTSFILEPNPKELLHSLLPLYLFYNLVQLVLEGRASEHSARMVSMKAATENASGIINDLTLDYNKARQNQITNELLEITTAMRAME